jgi:calcium/calmodulin-dependent protein kinase I
MAPEIFKKTGHGKPVYVPPSPQTKTSKLKPAHRDIWAIGVITYFLLCGMTPFDRDSNMEEMQAILNADYKFDPDYWSGVSETAKDFIRCCLTVDPAARLTAHQALEHPFLAEHHRGLKEDLLPTVKKNFNARRNLIAAIDAVRAVRKLREGGTMDGALSISPETQKTKEEQKTSVGLWTKPADGRMRP